MQMAMQGKSKGKIQRALSKKTVTDARNFQRLHQQLCERSLFLCYIQDTGCGRSVKTSSLTIDIVNSIGELP